MNELIETLNPDSSKQGVRIEKQKYDLVRASILDLLQADGPLTFLELAFLVGDQLQNKLDSSVMWYFTTVKLDMEARGEIRRVADSKPQLIEIVS